MGNPSNHNSPRRKKISSLHGGDSHASMLGKGYSQLLDIALQLMSTFLYEVWSVMEIWPILIINYERQKVKEKRMDRHNPS